MKPSAFCKKNEETLLTCHKNCDNIRCDYASVETFQISYVPIRLLYIHAQTSHQPQKCSQKMTMQSVNSRPTQIMQVSLPEFEKSTAENEQTDCKQNPFVKTW